MELYGLLVYFGLVGTKSSFATIILKSRYHYYAYLRHENVYNLDRKVAMWGLLKLISCKLLAVSQQILIGFRQELSLANEVLN